jgi:hypothetical protein
MLRKLQMKLWHADKITGCMSNYRSVRPAPPARHSRGDFMIQQLTQDRLMSDYEVTLVNDNSERLSLFGLE